MNYKIIEKRIIDNSKYILYEDEKTKARVLDISNDDANNFFCYWI